MTHKCKLLLYDNERFRSVFSKALSPNSTSDFSGGYFAKKCLEKTVAVRNFGQILDSTQWGKIWSIQIRVTAGNIYAAHLETVPQGGNVSPPPPLRSLE